MTEKEIDIFRKILDLEIIESDTTSNFGKKVEKCLLEKDEELIRILKERGKKMPFDMGTNASRNCFYNLIKDNKDSEIAIVGITCSGKSALWNQITNKPEATKVREHFYKHSLDEEGDTRGLPIFTSHKIHISTRFNKAKNKAIISVERNIEDVVECTLERKDWLAKEYDYNKDLIKEVIIKNKKFINKTIKEMNTNIIKVKLE